MRNIKIVNIRIIATFIVVMGHAMMLYSGWGYINVNHPACDLFFYLKRIINIIQMPLFFALSGYLQDYLDKNYNRKNLFTDLVRKKIKRLIVPYFFISCTFLLVARLISNYRGWAELNPFDIIVNILLMRQDGHLWFLPTLFYIFCFWFFLKKCNTYAVLISTFLVSVITHYFKLEFFHLQDAMWYMFWFVLGTKTEYINSKIKKYNILIPFILLCTIVTFLISFYGRSITLILSYIGGISFILWIFDIIPSSKICITNDVLDKNSLAIYLFHVPCIYVIYYYLGEMSPFVVFLISLFVSYMASILLAWMFRKVRLNVLIGEK